MLIFASMTLFLATQTVQPIFPLYLTEKGASTFDLGLMVSLASFTAMATKVPLGILVGRVGKWRIVPVALFGQSLSLMLYSVVAVPSWFYPIRVFHALVLAAFAPATIALASDLAPKGERGDRIGKYLTSFGAATMFGPFLCSLLSGWFDYTQILRLAATIPLLGLVILVLAGHRMPSSSTIKAEEIPDEEKLGPLGSLREIVFSRSVFVLSYLRLTFSFTNAFVITLFALYASEGLLFSPSMIATLFGVKGITNMIFRFPSGKLSDRIGHRIPLIVSFSLLAVSYLAISECAEFSMLSIAMAVHGLAHGMRAVTEWSLLGESAPSGTSSIATAYLSTMFSIGEALGALVSGVVSLVIPIQTIFRVASLVILPSAFIPFLIGRKAPQL